MIFAIININFSRKIIYIAYAMSLDICIRLLLAQLSMLNAKYKSGILNIGQLFHKSLN